MTDAMVRGSIYGLAAAAGLVFAGLAIVPPAQAQLGTIFAPEAPRPPGNVPTRPAPGGAPPTGAIQSQPLPPPPGFEQAPLRPQTQQPVTPPPQAARPPAQRPAQPAAPAPAPAPAAPAAPAPSAEPDEVVVAPPSQRIVNPTAVFSGLDKITGRIITFDVAINETVQFGALQVTPRVCYSRPATESPQTTSFMEVDEITLQGDVRRIFTGWMYAASPGLHAVEHPIYDVWLFDCKGGGTPLVVSQPERAGPVGGAAGTPAPGGGAVSPPTRQPPTRP
jgi:hypothetical protein